MQNADGYFVYLPEKITAHLPSFSSKQVLFLLGKEIIFRLLQHQYPATLIKSSMKIK